MAVRKFNSMKFLDGLAAHFASRARWRATRKIRSRTLRNAQALVRRSLTAKRAVWANHIPHYWAQYYHDDRRAFTAKKGKWLVWFRNPADDPRHGGAYPERLSQKKKLNLSRTRMRQLKRQKKLVFSKKVRSRPGEKFFDNKEGMMGFERDASRDGQEIFSEAVKKFLGPNLNMKFTEKYVVG